MRISFYGILAPNEIRKYTEKKKSAVHKKLFGSHFTEKERERRFDLIPSALLYVALIIRLTMIYVKLKKTGGCFTRPPNKTNNFPKGKPKIIYKREVNLSRKNTKY